MERSHSPWRGLAVLAAVLAGPAQAQRDTHVSFGLAYVFPDAARNATHGVGGTVGYAMRLVQPLWLEGRVFAHVLQAERATGAGSYSQEGLGLDARLPLGTLAGGEPFVLVGGGAVRNDVTPEAMSGTGAFGNAGLGWRSLQSGPGDLRYRVELRASHDRFDGGQTDVVAGFLVEFHGATAASPVAAAAAAPAPPTQLVRLEPLVLPPVVADEDGDGIPDERDRCAGTLAGASVEADGCVWEEQVVTVDDIRFATGSAMLTKDSHGPLERVVAFHAQQPEMRMDIHGHTDAQGSEAYNLALSNERAASVQTYLVGRGVAPSRLKAQGFGEMRPVDTNDTDEGRGRNRRVELHLHARQPR